MKTLRAPRSGASPTVTPSWVVVLLAAVLLAVLAGCGGETEASAAPGDADGVAAEKAAGDRASHPADLTGLHLALRADGALVMRHGSVDLREYRPVAAEQGVARFAADAAPSEVDGASVWTGGTVVPAPVRPRRVIRSDEASPPDLTGAVPWVPPLPEEGTPAPARFVIHFSEGLGLEIRSHGGVGEVDSISGFGARVGRGMAGLRWRMPWNRDRMRLRLTLPLGDAAALYRALSDSVVLAVHPRNPSGS